MANVQMSKETFDEVMNVVMQMPYGQVAGLIQKVAADVTTEPGPEAPAEEAEQ